jgi:phage protein D
MPKAGAKIAVSIGWAGGGIRQVFAGTVDEVRSVGSRSGGRTLTFTAKGFDMVGKAKDGQTRHWDDKTVEAILKDAGSSADVPNVRVDPDLASIVLKYFSMVDESFLHMGRRLAAQIGGHFRVQDQEALMAKRGGTYTPSVSAAFGLNLHDWDLAPIIGRGQYGKIVATWYDAKAAIWKKVEESTGLKSTAVYTIKPACTDEDDAKRQAKAMAETSKRDSGKGSVSIEGDTSAVPDGLCLVSGTRAGIDGSYRISSVTHNVSRSSGWITNISVNSPQGGAGEDTR